MCSYAMMTQIKLLSISNNFYNVNFLRLLTRGQFLKYVTLVFIIAVFLPSHVTCNMCDGNHGLSTPIPCHETTCKPYHTFYDQQPLSAAYMYFMDGP